MKTGLWLTGPPPATGQFQRYPSRFWYNFKKHYEIPEKVLHMFSGSMDWGDTTDIRSDTGATFVAPYNDLPIENNTYDMVIADPPYNKGFASEWTTHDKDLPKPKHILIEAARVTKPGGIIAILHIIVIPAYKVADVTRTALYGILAGPNNAIRVLNVFRKNQLS
jgi:SAM-dependent methyltransferase